MAIEFVEFKRREEMVRFSTNRTNIAIVTTDIDFVVSARLVPIFYKPLSVIYDIIVIAQKGDGTTVTNDVNFTIRTLAKATGQAINDSSIFTLTAPEVAFDSDVNIIDSTNKSAIVDVLLVHGTAPA